MIKRFGTFSPSIISGCLPARLGILILILSLSKRFWVLLETKHWGKEATYRDVLGHLFHILQLGQEEGRKEVTVPLFLWHAQRHG